ncbi:MAG: LapA family protein [Rhodobacteraceae bacterium]|nr:MAG: LapA family protein [Paracoccaceae bacterium]
MMAYLRYAFAALVAAVFIIIALANRAMVEVKLLPDALAQLTGISVDIRLPLFLILGLAIAAGLVLGIIWEWLREHSIRADAARLRRERDATRSELQRVDNRAADGRRDDVLALVDGK